MARGAAPNPQDTKAARALRAERAAQALRLSVAGWSYARIHRDSGLGYGTRQQVYRDVKRALEQRTKEQDASTDLKVQRELAVIERALSAADAMLDKTYYAHSNGRLITREAEDGTEIEIEDDGPRLAAADRLVRFSESRRKLLGLDAPTRVEQQTTGTIEYVIAAHPDELDKL
jgi:hypothetical protein